MSTPNQDLEALTDEELLASTERVYRRSREFAVWLIRHLILIDKRRLHLKAAYPSMYEFCVRRIGMSNSSASRHATAARLAARYPQILDRLTTNRLHMSTLVRMKAFITDDTIDDLLDLVEGMSRYQVDELLADLAPAPDAPASMRKFPQYRRRDSFTRIDRELEPLGRARYRVGFTADRELRDDIEHVRDLMRYSNPSGDLSEVFRFCVRAGLDVLMSRRMRAVRKPRPAPHRDERPRVKKTKAIPANVVRAVFERDGEHCTFHDETGNRCTATTLLDLDHIVPRGKGGPDTVDNLRVRCRAHNHLYAEQVYGKAFIAERIARARQRGSSGNDNGGAAAR